MALKTSAQLTEDIKVNDEGGQTMAAAELPRGILSISKSCVCVCVRESPVMGR